MIVMYPKAWSVIEMALLLSHGQASVERGFSVNKELVVENRQEESLIARRIIKDHIMHVNCVTDVEITRDMVLAARSARAKYSQCLTQQKEQEEWQKKEQKRKAENEAVHELQHKLKRLKTDISSLLTESAALYEKCEKTGKVTLVTKANALCTTADDKQEIEVLDKEIAERLLVTKQ